MTFNQLRVNPSQQGGRTRIEWVDTAKALGLFLVFWGHILYGGTSVAGVINRAIYSFHMPMYFILSGFVMKNDTTSFPVFLKNKFNRIVLPALLLYALTLPIYFYFLDYSKSSLQSVIESIFYVKGRCAYNKPIWFFFCMFQILVVVKILKLTDSSNKKLLIVVITSFFLSYACYESNWSYSSVFGVNKFLLGLFFFSFGLLLSRIRYEKSMKIIGGLAVPLWIISGVVFNSKVSMYSMSLGKFWLFIVSGISGSLAFFLLCKLLEKHKKIQQYSEWTIFIVCSHYVLVTIFLFILSKLSITGTCVFDLISAIFVLLALCLYKPICLYLNKHLPILLGNYNYAKNIKRNQ